MADEIAQLAEELKTRLREAKSRKAEYSDYYKMAKKLAGLIHEQMPGKDKLPDFFSQLHETTVDMRRELLKELSKERQRLKQKQVECEGLRAILLEKDKKLKDALDDLAEAEDQISSLQHKNDLSSPHDRQLELENQLKLHIKQLESLKGLNKKLMEKNGSLEGKIRDKNDREEALLQEIKRLKQLRQKEDSRKARSPSPDKIHESESRAIFENAYGSFSELPIGQNFTSLENTFSQGESDRKVKSFFAPQQKPKIGDQLWRYLYVQANAIEEFLHLGSDYHES